MSSTSFTLIDDCHGYIECGPDVDDPVIFRRGASVRFDPGNGRAPLVGKVTSRRLLKSGRVRLRVSFFPDPQGGQ